VVLPEAEDELQAAIRWYEVQREGLGVEFLGVIEAAMERVMANPLRWLAWDQDNRYRRIVLRRFPYLLFYEIRGEVIEFVAVAHTSRTPGYWRARG